MTWSKGAGVMSMINRQTVRSYAIAAAGVVLAGLSPWWFTPLVGDRPPMRLMLLVVVGVSAWLGGLGPGLFASAGTALVAIKVMLAPPGDWASSNPRLHIRFGSRAVAISVLFKVLHVCIGAGSRSRNKTFAEVKVATAV